MGEKTYYTNATQIAGMLEELAHARDLEEENVSLRKREKIKQIMIKSIFLILVLLLTKVFIDINSAKASGEVPTVFGYQVYEVQTGSMDPTLPVKSLIISKAITPKDDIMVGDIITFVQGQTTITHRVVDVIEENEEILYQTKGDNAMNSIDPQLLKREDIKAKFVIKMPFYLSSSEGETL